MILPYQKCWLLCVVLVCAAPVCAQKPTAASTSSSTASTPFDDLAKKAGEAREGGRLDEALELYGKGVGLQPRWTEGWWYLGTLYYDRDKYAQGRDALKHVTELDPKNGNALAMLALCEFGLKDYEQSMAHLEQARVLGVSTSVEFMSVVRYHSGILLTRFGHFAEGHQALIYLARYQNASPSVIEAFGLNVLEMPYFPGDEPADKRDLVVKTGTAVFYMLARRPVEAKQAFEDLIAKYPTTPRLHYFYGVFLIGEQSDAALEQFKKDLEISPENVYSLLQIATELINRTEYTAALPYAQKAVDLARGESAPHIALGRILVETGETDAGIAQLELAERFDPNNSKVHFALAHAYGRVGRKEDAAKERETFLRLDAAERASWGKSEGSSGGAAPQNQKPSEKPEK
ncbi:MAG: tetratricopeptide repeat protein [Blastocatellia bacterium]